MFHMDSLARDIYLLCSSVQKQLACIYKALAVSNVLTVMRLSVQRQSGGVELWAVLHCISLCTLQWFCRFY